MKKTKMEIFKVYYFASGRYSLAFMVYLECLYCIFSYTQPCFVDFWPISGFCSYTNEWGKQKNHVILTQGVPLYSLISTYNLYIQQVDTTSLDNQ